MPEWIRFDDLIRDGVQAMESDSIGGAAIYEIRVGDEHFIEEAHGPIQTIQIGKADVAEYRIGSFIGAALGFKLWHSEGLRLYDGRNALRLSLRQLEVRITPTTLDARHEGEAAALMALLGQQTVETLRALVAFRRGMNQRGYKLQNVDLPLPILMCQAPGKAWILRKWLKDKFGDAWSTQ